MEQTLFDKNIAFLDEKFAGLGSIAIKKDKENEEKIELEKSLSQDGKLVLKVIREDNAWYLNGKRNAIEPVEKWVNYMEKITRGSSVSLIGMGNGLYLEHLVKIAEDGVKFIVYEPSVKIFLEVLNCIDLEELSKKHLIAIVVEGINSDGLENMYDAIFHYELLAQSYYYTLPNYANAFPEETLKATKLLRRVLMEKLVNYNTNLRFSDVVIQNLVCSMSYLPDIYKTSQLALTLPKNIPAIVVAAGPSLNKNIQDLKLAKNKAFIIAADTAVKPLLQAGIVPDMFAIVDGKKPLDLFMVEGIENIPMVTSVLAAKEVMNYHKGKKIIYSEGLALIHEAFARNGMWLESLALGGSVATAAFGLCYMTGFERIILVGQDLALTGNKTHADGTFKDKMEELDTSKCPMVEGNYEELVPTRIDFKNYLEWYNWYIEGCTKHGNLHVINATEGGAKIKNTEIMTLKEAIERECKEEVDIKSIIADMKPVFNEEQRRKVVEYLHEVPGMLEQLERDAEKACKLYEKLYTISKKNGTDEKAYQKVSDKLTKVHKKVESNLTYFMARMCLTNAEYIMKSDQFNSEETLAEEMSSIADKGRKYMQMVQTCAKLFKPLTEEAFLNIK